MEQIDKAFVNSILSFTESLLKSFPNRITGKPDCLNTALTIEENLGKYCDRTVRETFALHPGSLYGMGAILAGSYIISLLFTVIGGIGIYISLALCVLFFVYAFMHYILYGALFDKLFKKAEGCNVAGILEPAGTVKQQVIIMGHHDSSYIFNFLSRFEKLAGIRMLLAVVFYFYLAILGITQLTGLVFWPVNLVIAAAGLIFVLPMFFFYSRKPSPGAGDNLNGSSIGIYIARFFGETKAAKPLKNTRLIILSTDGEEAGQRGAIAYAKKHKEELHKIPARVINVDSIYQLKELAVLIRDRHGTMPLSKNLGLQICDLASDMNYKIKKIPAPFGSGTDAAAFAKTGIESTSIIAMNTSMFDKGHIYHTAADTVKSIEPEAVEAVVNIIINYIICSDVQ